jgi:NAD(P)-dependent dehydrogenase (short-subunit alcohol dehydrogenase family)
MNTPPQEIKMTTKLEGSVVLVTGANGGLGVEFVAQSLARGATKVYAAARSPRDWEDQRVVPLLLDVNDPDSIRRAAAESGDTTVLINNAGINRRGTLATASSEDVRAIFDTNFFGALEVAQVYAPILKANGGGVLLNVASVLSWLAYGAAYSASKAALWSATNSLRLELAPQGTLVSGLYLGYTATPLTAGIDAPMNDPADIVAAAYDGIEAGDLEILADQLSVDVRGNMGAPISQIYSELAS